MFNAIIKIKKKDHANPKNWSWFSKSYCHLDTCESGVYI